MIYVLYHDNCLDGFGAAYAAWCKFGDDAEYIPVQYGQEPPENLLIGSEVYIVDFSYPLEQLLIQQKIHKRVVVLDHHKTAQQDLLSYKDSVFDMERSGCVIAWEYFNLDKKIPQLLRHIEDRDLWRFYYPETKAITAALWLEEKTFRTWYELIEDEWRSLEALYNAGSYLLKQQDQVIKTQVKRAYDLTLPNGETIKACNTQNYPSETCQAIMSEYNTNIAACWYQVGSKKIFSVRSRDDGDASALAKAYSGGGHLHAAGMSLDA